MTLLTTTPSTNICMDNDTNIRNSENRIRVESLASERAIIGTITVRAAIAVNMSIPNVVPIAFFLLSLVGYGLVSVCLKV